MSSTRTGILGTAMICAVCLTASAQKVSTDYDHQQDFSRYHTFSIHSVQSTDPLFQQRISDEITRDLQAKACSRCRAAATWPSPRSVT